MDIVVVIVLLCLLPFIIGTGGVLLATRALQRANRVSPQLPGLAPASWVVLPERPARLHRRLRRAVAMARRAAELHAAGAGKRARPTTIADLSGDLERRACVIDGQLVVASRTGGAARWGALNDLESQVAEVERLATRITGMVSAWTATTVELTSGPDALRAIGERLDALEDAMRELGAAPATITNFERKARS